MQYFLKVSSFYTRFLKYTYLCIHVYIHIWMCIYACIYYLYMHITHTPNMHTLAKFIKPITQNKGLPRNHPCPG